MSEGNTTGVVSVSRRIEAPAEQIFAVLADPTRHLELDGSEMLRGAVDATPISGVGDVFVMNMFFDKLGGEYVMRNHVAEFEPARRIAWTPAGGDERSTQGDAFTYDVPPGHRWSFDLEPAGSDATVVTETYDCTAAPDQLRAAVENGEIWRGAMTATLERLDKVVTA